MLRWTFLLLAFSVAFACETVQIVWDPSKSADPLYPFAQNDKTGYIDRSGRVVIEPRLNSYRSSQEFHNGLLEIAASDGGITDSQPARTEMALPQTAFREMDPPLPASVCLFAL